MVVRMINDGQSWSMLDDGLATTVVVGKLFCCQCFSQWRPADCFVFGENSNGNQSGWQPTTMRDKSARHGRCSCTTFGAVSQSRLLSTEHFMSKATIDALSSVPPKCLACSLWVGRAGAHAQWKGTMLGSRYISGLEDVDNSKFSTLFPRFSCPIMIWLRLFIIKRAPHITGWFPDFGADQACDGFASLQHFSETLIVLLGDALRDLLQV